MQGIWLYSYIALWVVVLGLVLGLVALGKYIGGILQQVSRVAVRMQQTPGMGPSVGSRLWTEMPAMLREVIAAPESHPIVAIFVSHTCPHCRELVPSLSALTAIPGIQLVVMTRDAIQSDDIYKAALTAMGIPYLRAEELITANGIDVVPTTMLVDPDGTILGKHHGNHLAEIQALVSGSNAA